MNKKEVKNCWEYMECPQDTRDSCKVFLSNSGIDCYFLTDIKNYCPHAKEFGSCNKCGWYMNIIAKK